ncbi:pyridoxamine 5'-phosphate oxidase family protein [Streptomyces sp. VRA16 Mangrove soil]|uniref:pyridoxamine 5'-phosphate oxidase family protein n=1 Tax=Streptomyces sp. VRA16 Mangrove soil TaxID=2817434 RepID=UPI001A9E4F6B|nr:TIGR03618 family F420-dependent PPOX class oxidoreductase [Streptomyces sp. VRA16 Mangrove soil]MBO1333659.1 TIGR03618 family F420-dependent PPOX class oxidoreductase [Streptomyces sp. VRA16 Mangrove soil]
MAKRIDLDAPSDAFLSFWRERHLCTLTTLRPDGTPHVVPVGVTYDAEARVARVITNKASRKVAHLLAGPGLVAVCQVDGRRWATLEGRATVHTDPERVADAERRYAERYTRTPSPNPDRVVIEIAVGRATGNAVFDA